MRIGHGIDVHKFSGSGPITLCGVKIEHEFGLLAHSDGDVAIHALCDAIIGAMGEGDIGHWFPDSEPEYENIDSQKLLSKVCERMAEHYQLENADLTILAQRPKLAEYIQSMRENISSICGCATEAINIKATTTENLGFVGREEGIEVHAVVLLKKR
ncbi:MAG TPA: 2-C-methyl-D-erythritol 2,4-cyclodiphosphate synthase [Aeromonadales bacterium]|nr:2-C-methyl-D-erythritol 2,4-cyclodiphosphate synthase [Aeromonadales bacterium]